MGSAGNASWSDEPPTQSCTIGQNAVTLEAAPVPQEQRSGAAIGGAAQKSTRRRVRGPAATLSLEAVVKAILEAHSIHSTTEISTKHLCINQGEVAGGQGSSFAFKVPNGVMATTFFASALPRCSGVHGLHHARFFV